MRLVGLNEFKTNDMQEDVYAGLHFGTALMAPRPTT